MNEIINYVDNAIQKYGKHGDGSFEFIGINISKKIDYKIYRKSSVDILCELNKTVPYNKIFDLVSDDYLIQNNMKICDFSKSFLNSTETFRVVFKVDKNLSQKDEHKCIETFLKKIHGEKYFSRIMHCIKNIEADLLTNSSVLMQLGVEVNTDGQLLGIKVYANINRDLFMHSNCDTVKMLESITSSDINAKQISEIINHIVEQEYNPLFIGINFYEDNYETKLYFGSKVFGFDTKGVIAQSNNILSKNKLNMFITEENIKDLYDKGVFIQGIAFTLEKEIKWKLYLNALPRIKL